MLANNILMPSLDENLFFKLKRLALVIHPKSSGQSFSFINTLFQAFLCFLIIKKSKAAKISYIPPYHFYRHNGYLPYCMTVSTIVLTFSIGIGVVMVLLEPQA